MAILIDSQTRVVVQGITGEQATFHTRNSMAYGTNVVAGVTPGKGGTEHLGVPVFETVMEARERTGANAAMIWVPPRFAKDAIFEAIDADMDVAVCVTDGIPVKDMQQVRAELRHSRMTLVGPNCPGVLSADQARMGLMPGYIHQRGKIGIVSRSGTLSYEAAAQTSAVGLGQTTVVGIGGDPVPGSSFTEIIGHFLDDPETEGIVLIGEIGGRGELDAAEMLRDHPKRKPVTAFIAGRSVPPGRRMGHAGAIISGTTETADAKAQALKAAGCYVPDAPAQIGATMLQAMRAGV